jgi:pyrimidine operon attenuation protein / uracil phosphoribosyltransferase
MSTLSLDAEALYAELLSGVRMLLQPDTALVGIWSGGAWLAERLQADLKLPGPCGVISSALHRDDYSARGLAGASDATRLPFAIDGSRILLIDDVLFTGRTIRAVINELYDFGRPHAVDLAVLVDRGGRELPIQADIVGHKVTAGPGDRVDVLVSELDGRDAVELVRP